MTNGPRLLLVFQERFSIISKTHTRSLQTLENSKLVGGGEEEMQHSFEMIFFVFLGDIVANGDGGMLAHLLPRNKIACEIDQNYVGKR